MNKLERGAQLRSDKTIHYNCAQSVLMPWAEEMGLTEAQAFALGANFGSGMRHGSTCGAVSAALMVLGMLGYEEKEARGLMSAFREHHVALDCATLLRTSHEAGVPRKNHCDGLVMEILQSLEKTAPAQ